MGGRKGFRVQKLVGRLVAMVMEGVGIYLLFSQQKSKLLFTSEDGGGMLRG